MRITYLVLGPRQAWTSVPRPVDDLVPLVSGEVKGVAVHWPGETGTFGDTPTLAQSCARLENERRFHTGTPPAGRGWNDLAYSAACDQAGRVFDCRGIDWRCAANGNPGVNRAYAAFTFLVGTRDTVTPAAVEAFRTWRHRVWLPRWPHATAVVGHRDLFATSCPGDGLHRLVHSGALALLPTEN